MLIIKAANVFFAVAFASGPVATIPSKDSDPKARASAKKTFVSTTAFHCTGFYRSYTCENTLYLNNCKNSIKIVWQPLRLPGNTEWARKHRNWCSITWDSQESVEERKMPPEKCDGLFKNMAGALEGFPEVKWQDSPCTHIGTPDGVLYTSQKWEPPVAEKFFHDPPKAGDLEPVAIRLEDVRDCVLYNEKKRVVHCPVLTQRVHTWLRKFLALLDVHLIIQNDLR